MRCIYALAATVLSLFAAFPNLSYPQEKITSQDESDSASEIYRRVHELGKVTSDTAVGGYVMRNFNYVPDGQFEADMARWRKTAEKAMEMRMAALREAGGIPDEAAEKARLEANLADRALNHNATGLETYAIRYFQKGELYRIE